MLNTSTLVLRRIRDTGRPGTRLLPGHLSSEAPGRPASAMTGEIDSRSPGKWWQRGVIYQIAPMSFQDSNSDGKGDLQGIIDRIPYLEWLGIDAVWLCPIYPSPMLDF